MGIDIQTMVKNLHPLEIRIILAYQKGDELTVEKVEGDLGFKSGNGNQALSWLAAKGLVKEIRREVKLFFELTGLGREWKEKGTPEERIIELVRIQPGLRLPDLAQTLGLDNKDAGSAFGTLSKLGALAMDGEKKVRLALPPEALKEGRPVKGPAADFLALIRGLLDRAAEAAGETLSQNDLSEAERAVMAGIAKKRGAAGAAFREFDRETVIFGFTQNPGGSTDAEALAAALRAAGLTGDETGP
jgi:phenylalanyl-tRNA synthetase alpha chain